MRNGRHAFLNPDGVAVPSCGARREIRVHFDRDCARVHGGDHFHRLCRCGNEWVERCSEGPYTPPPESG